MAKKHKRHASAAPRRGVPKTLADVLAALEQRAQDGNFLATHRADLASAVKRIAMLLGDEPAAIALDMPAISASLPPSTRWRLE
jgi:hypothetical protein